MKYLIAAILVALGGFVSAHQDYGTADAGPWGMMGSYMGSLASDVGTALQGGADGMQGWGVGWAGMESMHQRMHGSYHMGQTAYGPMHGFADGSDDEDGWMPCH